MPETKKPTRDFESQVSTDLDGVHLTRQRPAKKQPGQAARQNERSSEPEDALQPAEPQVVSKLIDFFRSL
jgi:hypothetical protein